MTWDKRSKTRWLDVQKVTTQWDSYGSSCRVGDDRCASYVGLLCYFRIPLSFASLVIKSSARLFAN